MIKKEKKKRLDTTAVECNFACTVLSENRKWTAQNENECFKCCTSLHASTSTTHCHKLRFGNVPSLTSHIKSISVFLCVMSDCQRCKNTSTERDLVSCSYPEIIRLGKRSGISQVQHGRTRHSSVPSRAGGMVLHHFRRDDSIVQSCGPPRYTFFCTKNQTDPTVTATVSRAT